MESLAKPIRDASDDYITDITEEALRNMSVSELIREAYIAGWKACEEAMQENLRVLRVKSDPS